jgi:hypothetical protein
MKKQKGKKESIQRILRKSLHQVNVVYSFISEAFIWIVRAHYSNTN